MLAILTRHVSSYFHTKYTHPTYLTSPHVMEPLTKRLKKNAAEESCATKRRLDVLMIGTGTGSMFAKRERKSSRALARTNVRDTLTNVLSLANIQESIQQDTSEVKQQILIKGRVS